MNPSVHEEQPGRQPAPAATGSSPVQEQHDGHPERHQHEPIKVHGILPRRPALGIAHQQLGDQDVRGSWRVKHAHKRGFVLSFQNWQINSRSTGCGKSPAVAQLGVWCHTAFFGSTENVYGRQGTPNGSAHTSSTHTGRLDKSASCSSQHQSSPSGARRCTLETQYSEWHFCSPGVGERL